MTIGGSETNVFADRNDFSNPTAYWNFDLGYSASLIAHNNHIRSSESAQYIISAFWYPIGNTATIDLGSNYWFDDGTSEQLDALIHDGNDDASLNVIVNYDPIRTEPVPTDKKSLGGIKALFR